MTRCGVVSERKPRSIHGNAVATVAMTTHPTKRPSLIVFVCICNGFLRSAWQKKWLTWRHWKKCNAQWNMERKPRKSYWKRRRGTSWMLREENIRLMDDCEVATRRNNTKGINRSGGGGRVTQSVTSSLSAGILEQQLLFLVVENYLAVFPIFQIMNSIGFFFDFV